jgi:hypothetical protein
MNRALARRSAFEGASDVRHFLAFVAQGFRRSSVELLAYAIMVNHFHLLVRSLTGHLSEGMRYAESRYTQWFNAVRGRDGALFRGRYTARPLEDHFDRLGVLSYIDFNPIEAKLVEHPCDYPFGSAFHYAQRSGPLWLARDWVEDVIGRATADQGYDPETYARWCMRARRGARWVAERRSELGRTTHPPLQTLIGAQGSTLREWLRANAMLADGTRQFECIVDPDSLRNTIAGLGPRDAQAVWSTPTNATLEIGLVRSTCGLTLEEVARQLGLSRATIVKHYRMYTERLAQDGAFASAAATVLRSSLELAHGYEGV